MDWEGYAKRRQARHDEVARIRAENEQDVRVLCAKTTIVDCDILVCKWLGEVEVPNEPRERILWRLVAYTLFQAYPSFVRYAGLMSSEELHVVILKLLSGAIGRALEKLGCRRVEFHSAAHLWKYAGLNASLWILKTGPDRRAYYQLSDELTQWFKAHLNSIMMESFFCITEVQNMTHVW